MEELTTYVHRTNTLNKEGKIDKSMIKELHEKNLISIYMWKDKDEDKKDISDWENLNKGLNVSKVSPYVKQFFNLYKDVEDHDVLVYAKYSGLPSKLGLVKKGSEVKYIEDEYRVFYYLEINEIDKIKEIKQADYPLLETLIPYYNTVSKVNKGKEKLNSIYNNNKVNLPLKPENLSANAAELICSEWLRTKYCDKKFRIKYLLMPMGGNNAIIDILGKTNNDEYVVCQVTTSRDKQTINKKMEKLLKFDSTQLNYKKVMFGEAESSEIDNNNDIRYVSIKDVFNDLKSNKYGDHKELLDFLINR